MRVLRFKGFAWWIAPVTVALLPCVAQDAGQVHVQPRSTAPAPRSGDDLQPRLKAFVSDVELVLVPVTVSDRLSRLVTGLQRSHFQVFEDGLPQKIEYFYTQDSPISVGIIFDKSGSMGDTLSLSRYAVREFMKASNPQDEFFLVTFSDSPSLDGDFTQQPEDIQGALLYSVSKGRTALWDAVYLGCRKMKTAKHPKRVLLVVSDGGENHSRYTYKEIQEIVRESDVQIYGVGIPGADYGPWGMVGLSQGTGGRTFEGAPSSFGDTFTKIAVELRNQYVLGYRPTNRKHDGRFRKIRVKLQPPRGLPPLQVSARKTGYYAPKAPVH